MRRTSHRRRFHTYRIVAARRGRYQREMPTWRFAYGEPEWIARKLSYGSLSSSDPWDCGKPRCGVCRWRGKADRKSWRTDWEL
jgi:hypothetical protein